MSIKLSGTIEGCHDLIKRLVELTDSLILRVEQLEQEKRELKERLNKNSSNSSKLPSQDFKKKKPKKANPNKGSGVKRYPGHFRKLLSLDDIDKVVSCPLPKKCTCGGKIAI